MKVTEYSFGTLTVGDHYIIGEMKEGADINMEIVKCIIDIADEEFKGEQWAYISNRVNSYSLHPMIHRDGHELDKSMIAFAAVVTKESLMELAKLEKFFANNRYKFMCFGSLEKAIEWVSEVLVGH